MRKNIANLLSLALIFIFQSSFAGQSHKTAIKSSISQTLSTSGNNGFYKNKGQIVDQNYKPNTAVKYLLRTPGFNVQLKQTGFSYDTYTETLNKSNSKSKSSNPPFPKENDSPVPYNRSYHRVDIQLTGCNSNAEIVASGKSKTYYNFFTAGSSKEGVSRVHFYQKVTYKEIYPHIDLVFIVPPAVEKEGSTNYYSRKQRVEYFFIVHPGGNANDIKLQYKGANSVKLKHNKLIVNVKAGNFSENIPSSYLSDHPQSLKQTGQTVKVNYVKRGINTYGFAIQNKDLSLQHSSLIIDPSPNLVWGTYYGHSGTDYATTIYLDGNDNVYTQGHTASFSSIATAGAYQVNHASGNWDVFVAKFNPSGSSLLWGTYYGGTSDDESTEMIMDANNNIYITGHTGSSTSIATSGAYQTVFGGGPWDTFIAKFNSSGTSLLWGTYYGGDDIDYGYDIGIDANNNVYVSGKTASHSNITTPGTYQSTYGGGIDDAFIAKFNSSGSSLLWGTYYGGSEDDYSYGMYMDGNNNIYITGRTKSYSGIATPGAYQTAYGGGNNDGFIAKFNSAGTSLLWGTYYGGNGSEYGTDIAVDAGNNVYVTGETTSNSSIASSGAYQTTFGGGSEDVFVAKFNSTGSSLLWGTYYGGNGADGSSDLDFDVNHNVYITGMTNSSASIATSGAYQTNIGGGFDIFIAKLNATGSALTWGTYYGGSDDEYGLGIALDASSNIYISGYTSSHANIATPGAYQTNYGGGANDVVVAKFNTTGCSNTSSSQTITKCNNYTWQGATYTATGTYMDTIPNSAGCDSIMTLHLTIHQPTTSSQTITTCNNYTWQGTTYNASGTYTNTISNSSGCDSVMTLHLIINHPTTSTQTITTCDHFTWQGNTYNSSGTYMDTIPNSAGCDSIMTLQLTIKNSSASSQTITKCGHYNWQGTTYDTSGVYMDTIPNAVGCDSIMTLHLTINQSIDTTLNKYICIGDSLFLQGAWQTTDGDYHDTLSTLNGCDSIINTHLTITLPGTTTNVYKECDGFTVTVYNNTYDSTGVYTDIKGCDTTITDLTIYPNPPLTLTKIDNNCNGEVGHATAITTSKKTPISYLWNTGSTDSSIANLPAGIYSVIITDSSGCTTTDSIQIEAIHGACLNFAHVPNVFTPNGDHVNDLFGITVKFPVKTKLFLVNRWGNLVYQWQGMLHKGQNNLWNGQAINGKYVDNGVYFYEFDFTDLPGNKSHQKLSGYVHVFGNK